MCGGFEGSLQRLGRDLSRRLRRFQRVDDCPWIRRASALVKAEGRILVCHQSDIAEHTERPAVESDDQVKQRLWVSTGEEENHRGDEHEYPEQATAPHSGTGIPPPPDAASDNECQHQVVRYGQQPPFDQHQSAREVTRVGNVECCRVVGLGSEGEPWVSISSKTNILNGDLDSNNSIVLKDHEAVAEKGSTVMGIVPLPTLCEALNQVDPAKFKFVITGTVDNPKISGFDEALMELVKPYLNNLAEKATEDLAQKGADYLKSLLEKKE